SSFVGKYFFADLTSNFIRVFDPSNTGSRSNPDTSTNFATGIVANPVDMAIAADGSLYYLARGSGGELLRISSTTNASAPTITQSPASQTIPQNGNVTFSVTASGSGTLTYQWQRKNAGASSFTNISGATSSSLTLTSVQNADNNAQFQVIVTNN